MTDRSLCRFAVDGAAGPGGAIGRCIRSMTPRDATLALLAARAADATLCPSEVARALAAAAGDAADWRAAMPAVHGAVDRLVAEGRVALRWKGQALPVRSGPYRIARAADG